MRRSRFDDREHGRRNARLRAARMAAARAIATHTDIEWIALKIACGRRCVRCGACTRDLVRDHIVPIYKGGSDGIGNIQPLCTPCNSSKGPECTDHRPVDWRSLHAAAMGRID